MTGRPQPPLCFVTTAQECHEASRQLFERGTPTASARWPARAPRCARMRARMHACVRCIGLARRRCIGLTPSGACALHPGEWRGHARDSLNTDRVRFPWVGSTTFRGGRDDLCVPDDGPFAVETMAVRVRVRVSCGSSGSAPCFACGQRHLRGSRAYELACALAAEMYPPHAASAVRRIVLG